MLNKNVIFRIEAREAYLCRTEWLSRFPLRVDFSCQFELGDSLGMGWALQGDPGQVEVWGEVTRMKVSSSWQTGRAGLPSGSLVTKLNVPKGLGP